MACICNSLGKISPIWTESFVPNWNTKDWWCLWLVFTYAEYQLVEFWVRGKEGESPISVYFKWLLFADFSHVFLQWVFFYCVDCINRCIESYQIKWFRFATVVGLQRTRILYIYIIYICPLKFKFPNFCLYVSGEKKTHALKYTMQQSVACRDKSILFPRGYLYHWKHTCILDKRKIANKSKLSFWKNNFKIKLKNCFFFRGQKLLGVLC